MGTITDKGAYLVQTKQAIKQALIDKGIEVSNSDTFRSYASKISEIKTGGETLRIDGKYVCRVFDYNGIILKEERLNTGDVFTMPDLPQHKGLITQGWSSPVDIINNQVVVDDRDLIFGVTYTTESGLSEFDIEVTQATGLRFGIGISGTKDWGDGVVDTQAYHTYENYGKYTIKASGYIFSDGLIYALVSSSGGGFKHIRLGNDVKSIPANTFQDCLSLETLTIPNTVTEIGAHAFSNAQVLKSVAIPNGAVVTSTFTYCYALENISIPSSVTRFPTSTFRYCYSLKNITIPANITKLEEMTFSDCYSLSGSMVFKNNISSVGANAFNNCRSLKFYDFSNCTSVPSLSASSGFSSTSYTTKIVVPDGLYDSWKTATNWSVYSGRIYKASEVTE